jgi:hypothetical protein
MTVTSNAKKSSVSYSLSTLKRAERALNCAPFQLKLFTTMRNQSVPLQEIGSNEGYHKGYTQKPLSESLAERELIWLIRVGLLRREVDGQGITDSFRLTPLGRQLVQKWEETADLPSLSWWERLLNTLTRWLILPV